MATRERNCTCQITKKKEEARNRKTVNTFWKTYGGKVQPKVTTVNMS